MPCFQLGTRGQNKALHKCKTTHIIEFMLDCELRKCPTGVALSQRGPPSRQTVKSRKTVANVSDKLGSRGSVNFELVHYRVFVQSAHRRTSDPLNMLGHYVPTDVARSQRGAVSRQTSKSGIRFACFRARDTVVTFWRHHFPILPAMSPVTARR